MQLTQEGDGRAPVGTTEPLTDHLLHRHRRAGIVNVRDERIVRVAALPGPPRAEGVDRPNLHLPEVDGTERGAHLGGVRTVFARGIDDRESVTEHA